MRCDDPPSRGAGRARSTGPRRTRRVPLVLAALALALPAAADGPPPPCTLEASDLGRDAVLRDLRFRVPDGCVARLEEWTGDRARPWPVRAAALTVLDAVAHPAPFAAFSRDFVPVEVAHSAGGAEAFAILAAWLPEEGRARELVEPLLLPGAGGAGVAKVDEVDEVLGALAGQPVHEYLRLLFGRGHAIPADLVRRLGETDDQDTRRFLNWYVGERSLAGMEGYLVEQVASTRPSTYPGQGRRLFEAAMTAGLSELIRAAERRPPWLGDETTPRGLALASLGRTWPANRRVPSRQAAARLAEVAARDAPGRDRGQWQLAADVVAFLLERGETPGVEIERALGALARQCLRSRGPLEPFSLVEETCRRSGVRFPPLTPAEHGAVWEITLSTLDARFLGAVARALPDAEKRSRLKEHLLGQGARAADGSLRVVRCWGADLEGPGDWCGAVAELGLGEAISDVERVLQTSWADPAAAALLRFGREGVPALRRFVATPAARRLEKGLRVEAIRACVAGMPAAEKEAFLSALGADPVMAAAAREALARP